MKKKVAIKKHSCQICIEKFCTKRDLMKHMDVHANLVCTICKVLCPTAALLETHLKEHEQDNAGMCSATRGAKAGRKLKISSSSLVQPIKNGKISKKAGQSIKKSKMSKKADQSLKKGKKKVTNVHFCAVCSQNCDSAEHLETHIKVHLSEPDILGQFKCASCSEVLLSHHVFIQHVFDHISKASEKKTAKVIICDMCGRKLTNLASLAQHLKVHAGECPFSCDKCGRGFTQKEMLDKHLIRHKKGYIKTQKSSLECNVCFRKFDSAEHIANHIKEHLSEPDVAGEFKCASCGEVLLSHHVFIQHVFDHISKASEKKTAKNIICDMCGRKLASLASLAQHLKVHAGECPFSCNECGRGFTQKEMLDKHLIRHKKGYIKTQKSSLECNVCFRKFDSAEHIANHIKEHLSEPDVAGEFKCASCGEVLLSHHVFIQHVFDHISKASDKKTAKVIICDMCGRKLASLASLAQHLKVHAGECPFSCDKCGRGFTQKEMLDKHLIRHKRGFIKTQKNSLECNICYHKFDSAENLETHIKEHLSEPDIAGEFKCASCGEVLVSRLVFIQHVSDHISKISEKKTAKNIICDMCGQKLASLASLAQHLKVHAGECPFSCDECGRGFTQKEMLDKHLIRHKKGYIKTKKSPLECNVCHRKFTAKIYYMQHMAAHNRKTGDGSVKKTGNRTGKMGCECDKCGKKCSNRLALERHLKLHSQVSTLLTCPICGKWFARESLMNAHVANHTTKLQCKICNQLFDGSRAFKTHQIIHRDFLAHVCEVCGERFRSSDLLSVHSQTHNLQPGQSIQSVMAEGKKALAEKRAKKARYACEKCGKRFCAIFHLQIHMNFHTGDKPFKCDECDKCYRLVIN